MPMKRWKLWMLATMAIVLIPTMKVRLPKLAETAKLKATARALQMISDLRIFFLYFFLDPTSGL